MLPVRSIARANHITAASPVSHITRFSHMLPVEWFPAEMDRPVCGTDSHAHVDTGQGDGEMAVRRNC